VGYRAVKNGKLGCLGLSLVDNRVNMMAVECMRGMGSAETEDLFLVKEYVDDMLSAEPSKTGADEQAE
jgi:hypothetical protein